MTHAASRRVSGAAAWHPVGCALHIVALVGAVAAASCVYGSTEVIVVLGTDVPAAQPLTITATVIRDAVDVPPGTMPQHGWVRTLRSIDGGAGDGGITLPASFAITPAAGDARNETVTLLIEGTTTSGTIRRLAQFRFVSNEAMYLPIFLTQRCLTVDEVCAGSPCSREAYCESMNETCSNAGDCVAVPSMLSDAGVSGFDVATTDIVATDATAPDVHPDVVDDMCRPNCAGLACGDDGCGGACGACAAGETCSGGTCVCAPNCAGHDCGDDGCGGACGACAAGQTCSGGTCVCAPNCAGISCGGDGCGGSCGSCPANYVCSGGACVCVPNCTGITCGGDGCGGSCGSCATNFVCSGGACVGQCYVRCCDGCLHLGPTGTEAACASYYASACTSEGSNTYRVEYGGACVFGMHTRCIGCPAGTTSCAFDGTCCGGAAGACGARYCSTMADNCNSDCP